MQQMLTLPEIKYGIGVDSSQFLPIAEKWILISLKHFKKPTIVASIPNHEEKNIVPARMNNKFGQALHLPEVPVHSCVQCTPTSQGTHTSPHMPPQPTPGKALIQTKRLLLAKAKAMLQRPQQSLFIAEAFNTTTIQKRNTAWHTEKLQQLSVPDCTERFRAFPARQLWVCCLVSDQLKPPSLESQPVATCAPLRIHNLFDSSNPRLQGVELPSVWQQERHRSQHEQDRTPASIFTSCVSSASQQGWMMLR